MRVALICTDNRENNRDYAAPQPRFGTAPEALLQGFAALPEVEFHVVSCVQQPVVAPEKIAPNIFYHGLLVPKTGWMRTLYQGCIRATRKKLRAIQPDIVHGQGTERDCAISAVFSGFPNVLTIHGNMKAIAGVYRARIGSFRWLAARLESYTLRRTLGVFCNSAYTEQLVAPRTPKTWRVPNALRMNFFAAPPAASKAPPPILLNIGFTEPRKQQLKLLEVALRLHQRGFKFELHFAGDRASQTEYGRQFAAALVAAETTGCVRHLGLLSSSQLAAAMDAASALVHFPTEEAFGLVVAEALARNLKFFGAATGGIPDIAQGAELAELISPGDFSKLENAIAGWLEMGALQPRSAAMLMRERYHPEVVARQHLEIYRKVLGRC